MAVDGESAEEIVTGTSDFELATAWLRREIAEQEAWRASAKASLGHSPVYQQTVAFHRLAVEELSAELAGLEEGPVSVIEIYAGLERRKRTAEHEMEPAEAASMEDAGAITDDKEAAGRDLRLALFDVAEERGGRKFQQRIAAVSDLEAMWPDARALSQLEEAYPGSLETVFAQAEALAEARRR